MNNILGKNYRIRERKSSRFGVVGIVDRGSELSRSLVIWNRRTNKRVTLAYYNNIKRKDIYTTALDKYVHDELAKPIINLIAFAIFNEPPDFQGNKDQVKLAKKIVRDSSIDWMAWGVDLEVHGDIFIANFPGKNPKLASIPPQTIDVDYDENNVIDIRAYLQDADENTTREYATKEMTHGKINHTSNMVYGSSTLRPVFWWLDVLDNLWERNWIRAAQYYGAPIAAITGVPPEHIESVRTRLQEEGQRPGKNWVFPPEVKVDTLDFTRNYPIQDLIDRVYQYILSACNIAQHLIYESDSSRGVAMFSGDTFEMMIKSRRRTWELIILDAMRKLFRTMGTSEKEFDLSIGWAPVFTRDLKSLAQLIDVGRQHKIFSLKSARERLQLDHSEEEENIKKEPKDEVPPVSPKVRELKKPSKI